MVREDERWQVKFDDPQTVEGLRRLKELKDVLDAPGSHCSHETIRGHFFEGGVALFGGTREDADFRSDVEWISVPLPMIPGGADRIRQASDLFCVRRQVNDFGQVREMLRLLLSPEIQERLGRLRYGIPIRRSAAIRSFNENDPRDAVFFSEMTRIVPDGSLAWPELHQLVNCCITRIWRARAGPGKGGRRTRFRHADLYRIPVTNPLPKGNAP